LVPPKVGIAVKVTSVPKQIGPGGTWTISTAGAGGMGLGLTLMEKIWLATFGGHPLSITVTTNWYGAACAIPHSVLQQNWEVTNPSPLALGNEAGGLTIATLKIFPVEVRNKLSPLGSTNATGKHSV
jgi:hypothetical protein